MTDEEMAKEYAKLNARQYIHNDGIGFCTSEEEVKQAFLAGLKAGRPKWHKVADGDLPEYENDVLVYSGEDWRMCVGRYSPKYKAWEAGCDTIAWCEVPKFEDKE